MLTSAVRDAANGADFAARVRDDFGLDARVLSGDEEAQLTFLGAMSGRPPSSAEPTVVIDIGGGSTEFVVGVGRTAGFHVSLPAGVVRMSERHIHSDPPDPAGAAGARRGRPHHAARRAARRGARSGQAAASPSPAPPPPPRRSTRSSTPTTPRACTATRCSLGTVELLLARLADMTEEQRRRVVGLHPDRAPTIVAGMILLGEAMRAFELEQVEVSEHDILYGGALLAARRAVAGLADAG